MALGSPGTWFGLPDFGITEALGLGGRNALPNNTVFNNPAVSNQMFPSAPAPAPVSGFGQLLNSSGSGTGGQVLGSQAPVQGPAYSGPQGGGGDSRLTELGKTSRNPSQESEYQALLQQMQGSQNNFANDQRNSINQGWDQYTNQLNDMLNTGLPGQQQAQNQMAQSSYQSGVDQLGAQRTSSEADLAKQQSGSLKDLSGNIQSLFSAGNTYLGARGAGDSSAANQYSYAIGKMGTKARGDIMTQVSDRMNQIGDIYKNETNRLKSEMDQQVAGISQWFNEAQNQIRGQIGQAGLGRSQDVQALTQNIYNQALQAMQQVQTEQSNRRSSLESWAMSNSKNVQELMGNMQQAQQMPQFAGLSNGMPQMTTSEGQPAPVGMSGFGGQQQKDLFGNIIG